MIKVCHVCGKEKEHKSWNSTTCAECLNKGLKWCNVCGTVQLLTNFHKSGTKIKSWCKACECTRSSGYHAQRYKTDLAYREHIKEQTRTYAKVRCTVDSEYHERVKEASRTYCNIKYATDPEFRARDALKKHLRRAAGELTVAQWLQVCSAFNNTCAYCGAMEPLTLDHVIPVSKGGKTTLDNALPACHRCNLSKSNKDMIQWYITQLFYSEHRLKRLLEHLESMKGSDTE